MKPHLSEHETSAACSSYFQETKLCEAIISGGVILFLSSIFAIAVMLAFTAYVKQEKPKEWYVVQSGMIEIVP